MHPGFSHAVACMCTPQGSIAAHSWAECMSGRKEWWLRPYRDTPVTLYLKWHHLMLKYVPEGHSSQHRDRGHAVERKTESKTSDAGENLSTTGGPCIHADLCLPSSPHTFIFMEQHEAAKLQGAFTLGPQGRPIWGTFTPCLALFPTEFLLQVARVPADSPTWSFSEQSLGVFLIAALNCIFLSGPWQSECSLIKDFQAAGPILPSPPPSDGVNFKPYF